MRRSGAVIAALGLFATGCGAAGGDDTLTAGDGYCTTDRVGGEATHGTLLSPQGLDPLGQPGAAGSGGTEVQALFDTLVVYDAADDKYEPHVAESLEPNADHTSWELRLRPDVHFGNGDLLTAADVKASIERHRSPDNAQASRGEAAVIEQMQVVDERTVRFVLDAPYPDFPHVLATDVGMITNPRVLKEKGAEKFALDPTGAGVGPYELERYAPGDEIIMKAKADYWGGPVCIETLRFISVAGADGTFEAMQAGEVDVALIRDPSVVAAARAEGFRSLPTFFNYGEGIVMNSASGRATSDVRIRQAVVAAIDPDKINERVFDGTALASSAFIADEDSPLYGGADGPAYDPELAARLVSEAKAAGWDGSIRLVADNAPYRVEEAIAVSAMMKEVGFKVESNTSKSLADVITAVVVDRDYDLALWGPNYTVEGMWALMNRQLRGESESNYYGYADPDLDKALADLRSASSVEDKRAIVARMQEIFNQDPFIAGMFAIEEDNLHSTRVGGLILNRGSVVRYDRAFVAQ